MRKFTLALIALALAGHVNAQWAATPDVSGKSTLYTNNLLFIGSNNGISVSTDECQTSTPKNMGLTIVAGNYFVIKLKVNNTIYAYSNKVYRSANNGDLWVECSTGLPVGTVLSNLYYFNSMLYATYQSGAVYTSTDGGDNWTLKGNAGSYVVNLTSYEGALYAGTSAAGMQKSTDGGATWSAANSGIAAGDMQVYGAGVHNSAMYIGTYSGKIYKFQDATSSWSSIYTVGSAIRCFYEIGNALMVGTDNGFDYSLNDGATWQQDNTGLTGLALYILDLHASDQNLFASDFYGAVYKRSLSGLGIIIPPTAVSQLTNDVNTITLFPNPATTTLSINCPHAKMTGYEISDLTGRLVLQHSGNATSGIDISGLKSGMYLCKVSTTNGTAIQKFVKQ